jgi:ribosome-associated toxin RatA of RatAB toxin-antitoxin module
MSASLLALAGLLAQAADPSKPHAHQGTLAPYPNPPQAVSLTGAQEASLMSGEPVYTQIDNGNQGRGVAVFLVDAPIDKVWSTINNYASYPEWVDGVSKCEEYKVSGNHHYVEFSIAKMGMEMQYYIDHTYGDNWVTWRLDYSRESDLDDSVGMWRLEATDDGRTRVEYSVDVGVSSWVPGFVRGYLTDQGIRQATEWVKKQAE